MRDQHQRLRRDDGDGREGVGIEAELGEEVLADHQRPLRGGQERVAVGLGARHHLGAEVLRRARAVLDDHRLAPRVDSLSAMIRGMVSRLAPGGAGTTILTVRVG